MTNGEKLCIDFPNMRYTISEHRVITTIGVAASFDFDWWNAEYKESTTKNDLGVREFEGIVVEYPPKDLCIYPEYKGKPYFSIKYKEGNDYIIGYGTYNPKVFSRYLRDYFIPSVTPQEPISDILEDIYIEIEKEYKDCVIGKLDDDEMYPCFRQITDIYGLLNIIDKYIDKYKAESEPQESEGKE